MTGPGWGSSPFLCVLLDSLPTLLGAAGRRTFTRLPAPGRPLVAGIGSAAPPSTWPQAAALRVTEPQVQDDSRC